MRAWNQFNSLHRRNCLPQKAELLAASKGHWPHSKLSLPRAVHELEPTERPHVRGPGGLSQSLHGIGQQRPMMSLQRRGT
jgi:hypothetical protein